MIRTDNNNTRGALFMMICMAGFGLNDAMIKTMATQMSLFQAVFLRGLFASAFIAVIVWRSTQQIPSMNQRDSRLLIWRLVGEIGGTICFLTAIFNMPLANATAILQTMPLAVTLGAAIFLKESVGWRRYLAIFAGFIGMLIIVRPGTSQFDSYSLWAIAACAFLVIRDLSTRQLSTAIPSSFVTLITAIVITLVSALIILGEPWQPVRPATLAVLILSAVCVVAGYLFGVLAMRTGDVGAVAPYRYSIMLWAIMLGILFFDEWPDTPTWLGAAILVAAGLYTMQRESKLRQ